MANWRIFPFNWHGKRKGTVSMVKWHEISGAQHMQINLNYPINMIRIPLRLELISEMILFHLHFNAVVCTWLPKKGLHQNTFIKDSYLGGWEKYPPYWSILKDPIKSNWFNMFFFSFLIFFLDKLRI